MKHGADLSHVCKLLTSLAHRWLQTPSETFQADETSAVKRRDISVKAAGSSSDLILRMMYDVCPRRLRRCSLTLSKHHQFSKTGRLLFTSAGVGVFMSVQLQTDALFELWRCLQNSCFFTPFKLRVTHSMWSCDSVQTAWQLLAHLNRFSVEFVYIRQGSYNLKPYVVFTSRLNNMWFFTLLSL